MHFLAKLNLDKILAHWWQYAFYRFYRFYSYRRHILDYSLEVLEHSEKCIVLFKWNLLVIHTHLDLEVSFLFFFGKVISRFSVFCELWTLLLLCEFSELSSVCVQIVDCRFKNLKISPSTHAVRLWCGSVFEHSEIIQTEYCESGLFILWEAAHTTIWF